MDEIIITSIEKEMKTSYLDYAMSVIVGRALPDVKDGLKPVHRRILYSMKELGLVYNKPYKKSARIVGDVLGKYHPHGDSSVYDAMVRLAQNFSLRLPLIDGQGNFGSIDGDPAASMRYTEARLTKAAEEMLTDLDKETVDFVPNFDESLKEPIVLPAKIPNLLVNGSTGIAVGMATNIPPHNLIEICDATIAYIDNPDINTLELMEFIKGPDFPTGGTILGEAGIKRAYETGKGIIKIRAKTEIEKDERKEKIIITEIPYMVNKSKLIEDIAKQVNDKKIQGITDIRDESDRKGMRVVITVHKESNEIVLNQLFKHTQMQTSQGMLLLALYNNQPKIMKLKDILSYYVEHRIDVINKRTQFDLKKAQEKCHILDGLKIALENIDDIIKHIKKSSSPKIAMDFLIETYDFSEKQAKAILDMKLQKLTSMEKEKILEERKELIKLIAELESILASKERVLNIIKEELQEMKEKYGNERKTDIEEVYEEIEMEDLIPEEQVVITMTSSGYIKRLPLATYKQQKRGGVGIKGTEVKDEDDIVDLLIVANTHDMLLCFTSKGLVHWLKAYQIPTSSRYSKGKAIINILPFEKDEKLNAIIPIKKFVKDHYLLMATKNGLLKKTSLEEYSRPRKGGIIAINLRENDELVNVKLTEGDQRFMLCSKKGMAVRFDEKDVRAVGRNSIGVKGINLNKGDEVVGLEPALEDSSLLTITEKGYGKRTKITEYRLINRGGKGVRNIKISKKNGDVVSVKTVNEDDEIIIISEKGTIIRTSLRNISQIGRNTQGVRVMRLRDEDKVKKVTKIEEEDEEEEN